MGSQKGGQRRWPRCRSNERLELQFVFLKMWMINKRKKTQLEKPSMQYAIRENPTSKK